MRPSRLIAFILVALFVSHLVYFYPQLPETIASHFDGAGRADGWMTKRSFLVLEAVILGFILLEFVGVPWLIERMPNRWINLPNRDHWLSPSRRDGSLRAIRKMFEWFASAALVFLIFVNQLVFIANIHSENLNSAVFIGILIGYFAFVAVWLIMLVVRFRRRS